MKYKSSKKFAIMIIFFIVFVSSIKSTHSMNIISNDDLLNESWRKEIEGVTIIYVTGSHYQMGYQYGHLLKEEIHRNCRAFFNRCPKDLTLLSDALFEWWQITNQSSLPQYYQDEIYGLLDGAELPYSDTYQADLNQESIQMYCSGISAWGAATQDQKLLHFRSLDSPLFKDPETDTYVHDNHALLIREPDQGQLSISPSIAGDLGLYGGFNEQGISISWVSGFSNDISNTGVPLGIRLKQALDYGTSFDDVRFILEANRTNALSYIISDAEIQQGFVNEQTATYSYMGTWDDATESQEPFWSLKDLVRRTNIFINSTISQTQRRFYNPSYFPYIMSLFRLNQFYDNTYYFLSNVPSSGSWIHYDVLSTELKNMHGNINSTNALPLLQRVYQGKTDIRYAIVTNLFNTGLDPWYQWVATPETGDISIAFANGKMTADRTDIHTLNLFELLT
jgi:hypothetical protein